MALLDDDVLNPDRGSGMEPRDGFGLRLFKSAAQAYDDVVGRTEKPQVVAQAPRTGADLMGLNFGAVAQPAAQPAAAPAAKAGLTGADLMGLSSVAPSAPAPSKSSDGDFGRGWDVSGKQLKQTAYGTAALIGDTIGSDTVKQWGLKGFKEAEKEVQAISKPSDEFTTALETGELGKWFKYSTGYLLGQVAEAGVAAIAGAAVGSVVAPGAGTAAGAVTGAIEKGAVEAGVRGFVGKMIDKEAAALVKSGVAKELATEQAVKTVYRTIGATTANTFLNATQELGSIYGDAVEEAAKNGTEYSLGKVWLSGMLATAVDSWADSKMAGSLMKSIGGKEPMKGIVAEAFKGGLREGLTEGVQTAIERWGADKDLTSKEAFKDYINSAAVGVLGGGISGSVSGAVGKFTGAGKDTPPPAPGGQQTPDRSAVGTQDPANAGAADAVTLTFNQVKTELNANPAVAAVLLQDAQTPEERTIVQRAITKAEINLQVDEALKDSVVIAQARQILDEDPAYVEFLKRSLVPFATEMPPGNQVKMPRRTEAEAFGDNEAMLSDPAYYQSLASEMDAIEQEKIDNRGKRPKPVEATDDPATWPKLSEENREGYLVHFKDVGGMIAKIEDPAQRQKGFDQAVADMLTVGFTEEEARAALTEQQPTTPPVLNDVGAEPVAATPAPIETPVAPVAQPTGKAAGLARVAQSFAEDYNEPAENFTLAKAPAHFNKLAQMFGVEIVAYNYTGKNAKLRSKAGSWLAQPDGKNIIALNLTKADKASLFVLGHEVFHELERRFPAQAQQLTQEVKAYLSAKTYAKYQEFYGKLDQAERTDGEITADVMGQMFTDREFWRQVGDRNPTLLQRVIDVIDLIINAFKSNPDLKRAKIKDAITDYEKVREMLATFVADNPVTKGKPVQGKPLEKAEMADFPNVNVRKVKSAEPKAPQTPEEQAKSAAQDTQKLELVLALLRDGNIAQAARTFKEADLYGKGFGSFTELQKQAKEAPKPQRDLERVEAGKAAPTQQRNILPQEEEEIDYVGSVATREQPKKKAKGAAEVERDGNRQLGLGLKQPKTDTPAMTKMRERMDGVVKGFSQIGFFQETMLLLHKQISDIDAKLKLMDTITTEENGEQVTFRVRNEEDENPGLWGTSDLNAYDRYMDGFIPDKPTTKAALLDQRRRLTEELDKVRGNSLKSKANLYRRSLSRMGDLMMTITKNAIRGGMPEADARAVFRDYMELLSFREVKIELPDREPASPLANSDQESVDVNQADMFEGARTVMGLINDAGDRIEIVHKNAKNLVNRPLGAPTARFNERKLEQSIQRGLRDGDFKFQDVLNAFRALGQSVPRAILEGNGEVAMRTRMSKHLAQNKQSTASRIEYVTSMDRVLKSGQARREDFTQGEIDFYDNYFRVRNRLANRRDVNDAMRYGSDSDAAFPGLLFNNYTLAEASSDAEVNRWLDGNGREAWFQDVAYALRRRPSLKEDILGSLDPADRAEFDSWVARLKQQIQTSAEVEAKSEAAAVLRGMDGIRGEMESTPTREVEVFRPLARFKPDVVGMVIGGYRALQKFAIENGQDPMSITGVTTNLRPRQNILPEYQSAEPVTVTFADGKSLRMASRYSAPLLNSIATDGVGRAANYVELLKARYGDEFYLSGESRTIGSDWLRAQGRETMEIPGQEASAYERQLVALINAEKNDIPAILDSAARLNSILVGKVDPDTGEILSEFDADEMAAAFIDDLANRALKTADVYDTDSDVPAAMRRGDTGFGTTMEDRAEQERRAGPTVVAEESVADLLNDEVEVEMMGGYENLFEAMNDEQSNEQTLPDVAAPEAEGPVRKASVPTSLENGPEFLFKRGPFAGVLVPAIVQEHVAKIVRNWKGAPRITVLPNATHLPDELRAQVEAKLGQNMGAKGLYHQGEVYLFADHMSGLADVEFTLFHEAYGHLGLRAFLGAKFDDFLDTAYRTSNTVRDRVDELMAQSAVGKLEAIDEVLSDMAAENSKDSMVQNFVGRVITGLRNLGFTLVADWLASKTGAELGFTLSQARKAAQNGGSSVLNGAPSEVRLAQAALPYELFSNRGGRTTAYARFSPITQLWFVFKATGTDIRKGFDVEVAIGLPDAMAMMRKMGRVEQRKRSGFYYEDKDPGNLAKMQEQRTDSSTFAIEQFSDLWNPAKLKARWQYMKRASIILFQNEYKPVFEVVEQLRRQGRINSGFDLVPELEGLRERMTGVELEQIRKDYFGPLAKLYQEAAQDGGAMLLKDAKLNLPPELIEKYGDSSLLDVYLVAMHAQERNEQIAGYINGMQDGGSGMFTKDAYDLMDAMRTKPFMRSFMEISAVLKQMSDYKLSAMYKSGMIDLREYNARSQYDNYVNLSGFNDQLDQFDDPAMLAAGRKFNSRKDKRALGRESMASDVMARTMMSMEAAIINAHKNTLKQKLLMMLEYNYDPDFATINKISTKRSLVDGAIVEQTDPYYLNNKNVMIVHVDGRPNTIEFKQTGFGTFADAIHGSVYSAKASPWPLRMLGEFNRVVGQMLTTWNPAWALVNYTRDVQTLYFNAVADGRVTRDMAKQMVRYLKDARRAAFHLATDGRRGQNADPKMIEYYNEMRAAGGATSFLDVRGLERQVRELEDLIDPNRKPKFVQVAGKLADIVESFNIPLEMAPRLAAYRVMRENGFTRTQAAQFSGEITVNFNMRGSAQWMRQAFLFFNPAVQGSAKLVKLGLTNKATFAKIAGGMFVVGFLANIVARALGGDDEDGKEKLDKVPVFKRATSVVLLPDVPGAAIPIPYGWNVFFAAGNFMADTLYAGTQSAGTTAKRILQASFESFSPIGSAGLDSKSAIGTIVKGATPTALLPLIEIWANENRYGAPIVKEANLFGTGKRPDSQMAFDSASPISSFILKGLNTVTGGDKINPGWIDFNPGHMDYLINSYVPGLGAEMYKFASWSAKKLQGYDTKGMSLPIIDRFTAKIPEGYDFGALRRAEEFIKTKYDDFKANPEHRERILEEFPELGALKQLSSQADYRIQKEREHRKKIDEIPDMPNRERVEMINESKKREEALVKRSVAVMMELSPRLRPIILASE